jgi:RHS repeat-associated protein
LDEFGNDLTMTEAWPGLTPGHVTTSVYDLRNRTTSITDPSGAVQTRTWDAAGNETSTVANGATTARTFDGRGYLATETIGTVADAVTTIHVFNGQGAELQTLPPTVTITRVADFQARIKSTSVSPTSPTLTQVRTYSHTGHTATSVGGIQTTDELVDRLARRTVLVEGTGAAGVTTTTTFDANGNVVGETEPQVTGPTIVTTTEYDALDRVTKVIRNDVASPSGTDEDVTTTTYLDAAGNVVATKDPAGVVTRTFFNARGLPLKTIANCKDPGGLPPVDPGACAGSDPADASTNVTTTMVYDGAGLLTATTTSDSSGLGTVVTGYAYDPAGRDSKVIVDVGGLNLTTETGYNQSGQRVALRDPRGTIARTFFDTAGRVTKVVANCTDTGTTIPVAWATCAGTGTADATWNVATLMHYDSAGRKDKETAPNGRQTVNAYDAAGRIVATTENFVTTTPLADENLTTTNFYDASGNLAAIQAPTDTRNTFAVTRFKYDALNRLTNEIRNCTDSGSLPAAPASCAGTWATVTAATNVETITTYDDRGNRIAVSSPDPAVAATSGLRVTTQFAYDGLDRLCRVLANAQSGTTLQALASPCTTPVSGTTTTNVSTRYAYDARDSVTSMIDGNGNTTGYGFDALGRAVSVTDSLGKTMIWRYDALGQRIRQENRSDPPLSSSIVWAYDKAGRQIGRTANGTTLSSSYDEIGNRLTASDGTLTVTAAYDRLNRPLTVDDEDAGTTPDTTYAYGLATSSWTDPTGSYLAGLDQFGRPTSVDGPAIAAINLAYRPDGQLSNQATPNGDSTAFAYDAVGRELSRTTTAPGPITIASIANAYNRAGQILSESSTISGDPSNGTTNFTYDSLDRLINFSRGGAATNYGWDEVPNRTSVQIGAAAAVTTSYDIANRPATDSAGGAYGSDADGRLTVQPGQKLEWDSLGRLTKVKNAAGTVTIATYSYDPLDRLRIADYGTARVRFRYVGLTVNPAQTIDDTTGAVVRNIGTGLNGERYLDWTGTSSNLRYYGLNAHQDTVWTGSTTGAVTSTLRYDPWGATTITSGASLPEFRFQGAWSDAQTMLTWMTTRWYSPALGRFISEDRIAGELSQPPSRHLYAYGGGEPVVRWDPSGQSWLKKVQLSFANSIPGGDAVRPQANVLKLRISSTGCGPLCNWFVKKSSSLRSSSVLYTGRTATRLRPKFIGLRVVADTLSWSGSVNMAIGLGSVKFTATHRLVDVTAGITIAAAVTTVGVGCGGFFNLSAPSGCGPFDDNLNSDLVVLDVIGRGEAWKPVVHNHRYAFTYAASISATASPWLLSSSVQHDAIGFHGSIRWWQD